MTEHFIDNYKKLRRVPQIMILKDISAIVAETGINNKSLVVDAGAGSGALACFLANICKRVVSYELRNDFAKVAEENAKKLGLKNLTIKNKDVKKLTEKNVDLITLDLPDAWRIVPKAEKALRQNGFLVAYCPQITQIIEFVAAVKKNKKLVYVKTMETFWRQWLIDEKRARPENTAIVHTGFLCFARKK